MQPHRGAQAAQAIARRLAEVMAEQGLSANALAQKSGVNRQAITNVLRGEVWPDMLTLIDLEGALGVVLWPTDHVHWKIPTPGEPADAAQSDTADRDHEPRARPE